MTALGYQRGKKGGAMRYEGVALTIARPAPLRVVVSNPAPEGKVLGRMVTVGAAQTGA